MKKSGLIGIILIIVLVVGAGVFALTRSDTPKTPVANSTTSNANTPKADDEDSADSTEAMKVADEADSTDVAATITYSNSGYSPSTITVKAGDVIEVKNTSSKDMEFESNPHPVHSDNKQLNLDEIAAGASRKFSISNTGTWGYHNHLDSSQTGTIIVQ